ncbi:MAG: flagellar protein FlgN [Planctomycetota bacterium]
MGSIPSNLQSDFLRLLRREVSLYSDLLGLLRREKEALLKNALADLAETNQFKKDLIADLQQAEGEREALVSRLAEALGIRPADVTLSKMTALLEDREAADLSECGSSLSSVLSLCQQVSRENAILLEHSFDLVGSLISTIAEPEQGKFTYLPSGGIKGETVAGHLVERRA